MSLRWRVICWGALTGLLTFLALANFAPEETRRASWWLPDSGIRLGLDLRGGVHIVIGPDLDVAIGQELGAIGSALAEDLKKKNLSATTLVSGHELRVTPASPDELAAVREVVAGYDAVSVSEREGALVLGLVAAQRDAVRERAMQQALEVLRRRVDDPATGIPESVITRQGQDRILVEIPGMDRVPDIFRQTGFLEFKIVQDVAPTEELLRQRHADGLPPGTTIAFERDRKTDRVLNAYLVPEQPDIKGDYLTDARVSFDNTRAEWKVSFTWSAEGGRIFADLTEKNMHEPLAIILDGHVYSAPVIQARISRQGEITGRFTSQEATDLAVILRAGALPIPIRIEEERTIGPALGHDSIRSGMIASLIGTLVVVAFMAAYYKLSGVYASFAVILNLFLLVGVMSLFEGTLTMPGIAGLVLTVGMAVDGNVIIFERIRDELRTGRTPRAAISAGFEKAFSAIMDANITTLITAIILYQYGTGPIKGFAVTLSVGIVTTVFTVIVITRLLYDLYPGDRPVQQLSV